MWLNHYLHSGQTGHNVLVDVVLRCKYESVDNIVGKTNWRFDSVQQVRNWNAKVGRHFLWVLSQEIDGKLFLLNLYFVLIKFINTPFTSCFYLFFITSTGAQPFIWKWVWFARQWTCKKNSFPHERLCTKTRFEIEVKTIPIWPISQRLCYDNWSFMLKSDLTQI